MDVELVESDDDGVDMVSSKMTLVECRECNAMQCKQDVS